jgi:cytidine deaminase
MAGRSVAGCRSLAAQLGGWQSIRRGVSLSISGRTGEVWRAASGEASAPAEAAAEAAAAEPPLVSPTQRTKLLRRGARQKGTVLVDLSKAAPAPPQLALGILGGKFVLEAAAVQALLAEHSLTEEQLLAELIMPAAELARPPISSFHVGWVLRRVHVWRYAWNKCPASLQAYKC